MMVASGLQLAYVIRLTLFVPEAVLNDKF